MNIGFVSTWFERGASYVTKSYIDLLKDNNNIFLYARGGEYYAKGNPKWDLPYVTWAPRLRGTSINFKDIKKWIQKNKIEILFFNEQHEIEIIYRLKLFFPHLKIGSYIDYYKEDTVKEFYLYDFLICNTKRHYSVFKDHPQCFYVPWGTDTNLFKPEEKSNDELVFFHSGGMSNRKGTTFVIDAFINGKLYNNSKLIIHIQKEFEAYFNYKIKDLKKYNIEIIEKTVTAPGLYYLGDVYIYPTMLDGLGLTMYEALASGLPVITTDHPPMNEVIDNDVGYLVDVDYLRSREDGYYWPLAIVNEKSLINGMKSIIKDGDKLNEMKGLSRERAIKQWNWNDRTEQVNNIFKNTKIMYDKPNKNYISKKSKVENILQKIGTSYLYDFLNKIKRINLRK